MLGCYGQGKADQLAEIVGAVVLAGDVSLGSAVLAGDWVSSHDRRAQPTRRVRGVFRIGDTMSSDRRS